ncbi:MAG: diguanylate cyclase [Burkholderiales bacterium]
MAAGKLDRRIAVHGLAEVEDVARALNEMLDVRTSTEAALRESEAQRAGIIDSAMDAIVTVDDRQNIVIFNKAAERMFRNPASACVGEPVQRFFASADRAAYRRQIETLDRADGDARSAELLTGMSALRADGETFPVEVTVSRTTAAGKTLYTVILRDITERKRAQQQIEKLATNLEKRVAERTLQLETANVRLQRYAKELTQLGEISNRFQACTSVKEAACAAAQFLRRLADAGGVFLVDSSRKLVEAVSCWGDVSAEEQLFRQGECLALLLGKMIVADGSREQPRCRHVRHDGPYLCAPIVAQGETLGILHLSGEWGNAGHDIGEDRSEFLRIVQTVAERTNLALVNLRLRETLRAQSIRDPLTHLYNRRFLEETLDMQESLARRKGTSIGLMMIDVDHFKAFNDTHGHDAGDQVLRELAKVLQTHTRTEDVACRYGGEELCVVLPGASPGITRGRADQLRRSVAELPLERAGTSLGQVTISIGVSSFPDHGANWHEVLKAADTALYRAKQQGRNRVAVAGSPPGNQDKLSGS